VQFQDKVAVTTISSDVPKEVISGAPQDLTTSRVVRIYQESKPATQSSHNNGKFWKLDWDVLGAGNRWENDLMGYQGSADYMQGTIMKFDTKEAATRFAQGQGWDYYVQEPNKKRFRKKEYATNFIHSAGPLKHIRTK
jgi:NADH dehydrogenase (ubiquinone) Fe-S protein 4